MSLIDFAQGIRFRQILPESPSFGPVSPSVEIANTLLPESIACHQALADLCQMPKMSTFAMACLIQKMVSEMPADSVFLNIGVWHGFSFFSGLLGQEDKTCIGVDNFSNLISSLTQTTLDGHPQTYFESSFKRIKSDRHFFYQEGYQDYFKHHTQPIGVYIYDADHAYESQLEGLRLAEPFLIPGAYIFIDDTNWPQVYQANLDFMAQSKFDYDLIFDQMTANNAHPTFWNGLMIMRKRP